MDDERCDDEQGEKNHQDEKSVDMLYVDIVAFVKRVSGRRVCGLCVMFRG